MLTHSRIRFLRRAALRCIVPLCAIGPLSCYNEEEDCNEPPLWCEESRPVYGGVTVKVSPELVPCDVQLYYGKVESGTLEGVYRQEEAEKEYSMSFDDISAKAIYTVAVNGAPATVAAVDGGNLTCGEKEYCDGVICYKAKALDLDLRLDASLLEELQK